MGSSEWRIAVCPLCKTRFLEQDRTSQVTIATKYAATLFEVDGMARTAVYVSLSFEDKDHALLAKFYPKWARSSGG